MAQNKTKLLRILELIQNTDENSSLTANEIVEILKNDGISIERKAVYSTIDALIEYGYDIVKFQGNKSGYYLRERDFEDWELKVLIDAVAKMKFLNDSDIKNIIKKIKKLTGNSSKKVLNSSTLINNTCEKVIEKSYVKNNIDIVMRAISRKRKLRFQYTYLDENLKRVPRREGKLYTVNPYVLVMPRGQYYLICNYEKFDDLAYYRLDRIKNAEILEDSPIRKIEEIIGDDTENALNEFVNKSLYQFCGEMLRIKLRTKKWMIEEICDYFEEGLRILSYDAENADISIKTYESDGLYYWLMQHGENVKVLEPENVRDEIKSRLKSALSMYEK